MRNYRLCHILNLFIAILSLHATLWSEGANPRKKKVLICGVCKNVANALPNTIQNIEELGSNFKDYAVIIYENNSTDNTAGMLRNWVKRNSKVTLISENLTHDALQASATSYSFEGSPCRMEIIARARNIVLSHAKNEKYKSFDYVIMADLDFHKKWPIKEILKTVQKNTKWDCVASNGIAQDGSLFDRYAYRDKRFPFGPEILGEKWWQEQSECPLRLGDKKEWVPVYSAFGGLAIYKRDTIIQFTYSGKVTEELRKDCRKILRVLSPDAPHITKYKNVIGMTFVPLISALPIKFCTNSGYSPFPVCCEHVTLHASMRLNGFGKIYVNPQMIMEYSH